MDNNWEAVKQAIQELSPESILWDGFDEALVGLQEESEKAVYDTQKMVSILRNRDDMTEEEALEYLSFNVFTAYVGERTPIHIRIF